MTDTQAGTADVEGAAKPTEEQQRVRAVGRAIWRTESAVGTTPEEKKSNWSEDRRKYLSRAVKLLRVMEKEGLEITFTPKA